MPSTTGGGLLGRPDPRRVGPYEGVQVPRGTAAVVATPTVCDCGAAAVSDCSAARNTGHVELIRHHPAVGKARSLIAVSYCVKVTMDLTMSYDPPL